jgi:cellulase
LITPGGEEGLGYWITDELMHSNFTAAATLPKNLKPGNYVLRHEIIALHGARQENGAQAYPQCVNIEVGGSGQVAPVGGVTGIALYEATDPGIKFDIYARPTSYPLPGPALWTEAE